MNLNKRNNTVIQKKAQTTDENNSNATAVKPGSSKQGIVIAEEAETRRFLPHQMPVQGSRRKKKDLHNIFTYIDGITGPMSALKLGMKEERRVRVMVRNEHGIRGSLEGTLIWFDKFWNLWLRDVEEKWQRRKYKYGVNKMCGEPQDCSRRLQALGIVLPKQEVKSINRKNVEICRHLHQLLVRGEEVAVVIFLTKSANTTTLQIKS
uniref:Small nuclear ribonucleoprotein Sm D-like protein n=1 Tax=Ceratitis capitata TaxID=7213 RepID=W8BKC0_CERCA